MPDVLDLILIVLIAAFAVAGYRQGFIIGVLSLAGFIAGVVGGAHLAPSIARALARSPNWQAFVAIVVVFGLAVLGMLIASGIGVAVRSRLTARPATFLDSLGGAAVNVVAVLIVAWLIGSFVVNGPFQTAARQVSRSVVLGAVDKVMPHAALGLPGFPQLLSLLGNGLYSPVFSGIGAESSFSLPAPSRAALNSPALSRDEPSIVKIAGAAPACSEQIDGSGFVISPQHVLTNAHVVAGVHGPLVIAGLRSYDAQVVLYDPRLDVAVLDVPGLTAHPLTFAGPPPFDTSAIVVGYPHGGPLSAVPATVGVKISALGPDIYHNAVVRRAVYPIRADVQPGNSGGPLLSRDGQVYGVVFAASTEYPDEGYALTGRAVARDAARGSHAFAAVSTQSCQGA